MAKIIGRAKPARLLAAVVGLTVILASNAEATAKTQRHKPAAPQTVANNAAPCRGANLFHCGPITNGDDYLGTDPGPFIRAMIQRDLGAKYGGPE